MFHIKCTICCSWLFLFYDMRTSVVLVFLFAGVVVVVVVFVSPVIFITRLDRGNACDFVYLTLVKELQGDE